MWFSFIKFIKPKKKKKQKKKVFRPQMEYKKKNSEPKLHHTIELKREYEKERKRDRRSIYFKVRHRFVVKSRNRIELSDEMF